MQENLTVTETPDRVPLVYMPGITDVIPDDLAQPIVYLKTGEPDEFDYRRLQTTLGEEGYDLVIHQPCWRYKPATSGLRMRLLLQNGLRFQANQ